MLLLTLGGAILLVPQARAQSEIAPDHFDGTDSWAAATKVPATPAKSNTVISSLQARSTKPGSPTLQPVAAHEAVAAPRSNALATKKRKPAPTNN